VFSLAVAFVCLAASLLVVENLRAVEARWARAGRATIFLKTGAPAEDVEALRAALAASSFVAEVRHVTPELARKEALEGGDATPRELASLPREVFPASLEVDVRPETSDRDVAELVAKVASLPVVDDVETYGAWTERLGRLVRGGVLASVLLATVVLVSVLAVVGSTVRLALQRRRPEVEVLRLVGATHRYIKGPFLVEGSVQGSLGALAACGLLGAMFVLVRGRLDSELAQLFGVEPHFLPWWMILGLVGGGAVLGALAAMLGLRRLVTV